MSSARWQHGSATPTVRTLSYMRENGYTVQVVEYWMHVAKIRKDLWGFVDILAMNDERLIGIQCTTNSNLSARRRKIVTQRAAKAKLWLQHAEIQIFAWRPESRHPVIESITLEMLET